MADAMCGPANALKGLAGHLDRDNSRQQDRFAASPQIAAQNFRSSPAGSSNANASFAAFQNGNNTLPGIHDGGSGGLPLHTPATAGPASVQANSHWHSEFSPAPISQAPQSLNGGQSWINDFQRMNLVHSAQQGAQPSAVQHNRPPEFLGSRAPWDSSFYGFNNPMPSMAMQMPGHVEPAQVMKAEDDFDFDAAMSQWLAANSGPEEQLTAVEPLADSLDAADRAGQELAAHQPLLSSNSGLQEPVPETMTPAQETEAVPPPHVDSGELAAAARQVVQSVSNETNDKFAKSDFFAFMRRLGNEEIVLRGTEFVEAGAADQIPTATNQQPTDKGKQPSMQATVEDA